MAKAKAKTKAKKKLGRPTGSTNGKTDESTTEKFDRILMGRLNTLIAKVGTLDKLNARGWKKSDEHTEKMNKGIDYIIERLEETRPRELTTAKTDITLKDIMGEPEPEPEPKPEPKPEPTKTKEAIVSIAP